MIPQNKHLNISAMISRVIRSNSDRIQRLMWLDFHQLLTNTVTKIDLNSNPTHNPNLNHGISSDDPSCANYYYILYTHTQNVLFVHNWYVIISVLTPGQVLERTNQEVCLPQTTHRNMKRALIHHANVCWAIVWTRHKSKLWLLLLRYCSLWPCRTLWVIDDVWVLKQMQEHGSTQAWLFMNMNADVEV